MTAQEFFRLAKRLKDLKASNPAAFAEEKKQYRIQNNQAAYGICQAIDQEFEEAGNTFAALMNQEAETNARFLLTFIFRQNIDAGQKVVQESYKSFNAKRIAGIVARAASESSVAKLDRVYALHIAEEAYVGGYSIIALDLLDDIDRYAMAETNALRDKINKRKKK